MKDSAFIQWQRDQRRRGLRPYTIEQRSRCLLSFRGWLARPLTTATTEEVETWLDSCRLGNSGRHTYLKHLRSFYSFAKRAKLVRKDPVAEIPLPRVPKGLPHPIPCDELAHALEQADPRMRAWLALAAFQGMRCFEIVGLRAEHVVTGREDPVLVVAEAKGGDPRVLPLNPVVLEALRAYGMPRVGYVFTRQDGRPLRPGTVSAKVSTFLHGLGINHSAHGGRHSFGTEVYRLTRDIRLTQELLGHASLHTTQIYTKLDPRGADVVRQLGQT